MKIRPMRERLLASTFIVGAFALASTGHAADAVQTAPNAGAQAPAPADQAAQTPTPDAGASTAPSDTVKEIVVTGTLFRRTNTETPSPVTVLSSDQLAKQGIISITDAVRSISADNSGTIPTAFGNGFAAGAAGVSLRGLTASDTLVLIDGLRTANYPVADDGTRSFVDLNTIPFSVLDRVEVLKDGASSIYGSDAVAGVVNIITKPQFKGFEADASYGDSQHGGGQEEKAYALLGYGDLDENRFNVYVDAEYQNDGKIGVGQRGFPFNTGDLTSIGGINENGYPSASVGSTFGSVTPGTLSTPGNINTGVPLAGAVSQPLRACGAGYPQTTDPGGNVYCNQNFANYHDDQPAQQRWGLFGKATAKINDNTTTWIQYYYYDNKVTVNGAPAQVQSGSPNNTNSIALPPGNPSNPFAGEYALINYAFGDINATSTFENRVMRGSTGIKGEVSGWRYEADITIAHAALSTVDAGFIDNDVLQPDILNGTYNFANPAANSAAVLAALSPPISKTSTNDLDTFDFNANHDIYKLPGGELTLAFGGQFRYESDFDPNLNPKDAAGNFIYNGLGYAQTIGHRSVGAAFFEVEAPIIKSIDIDVSGRYDHYSDFGSTFNPKVGATFTPFRELKLRATYADGFRAPSFSQNGASGSEGFVTFTPASQAAAFAAAHGNDGYVNPYSLGELSTSNPDIQPETSESFTAGAIYEPDRHINISLDYYHIRQSSIIAPLSPSIVLGDYLAGTPLPAGTAVTADAPDPAHPGALARPLVVSGTYINANALTTDGIDVDARARYTLPFNVQFVSELNATDIFGYRYTFSGETFNYVGTQAPYNLSSGAGTPKYKVNWANTFTYGPASITGTVYYTSGYKETGADITEDSDVTTGCLYPLPTSCKIRGFTDVDMTGTYQVTHNIQVYFNILNLFDANPPFDPANYAGVNYNPTYTQAGIVGRYFRAGAHVKF